MDGLIAQVCREYGFVCKDVYKDRNRYMCAIDGGLIVVRQARLAPDAIPFVHAVKEALWNSGFTAIDRFVAASDGRPFVEVGGEVFTAFAHIPGKDTNFGDKSEFTAIVRTLGQMHKISGTPGFYKPELAMNFNKEICAGYIGAGLRKQLSVMRNFRKNTLHNGRLSDFDVFFLKNFDDYERLMVKSLTLWEDERVAEYIGATPSLAHNSIKEETVLMSDGIVYITSFDDCSADSSVFDLTSVIKRHLRTGGGLPLGCVLDIYNRENPLSDAAVRALKAILLTPDKFYKTSIKYYSKKRSWTPASFSGVIEDQKAGWDAAERYVAEYSDI